MTKTTHINDQTPSIPHWSTRLAVYCLCGLLAGQPILLSAQTIVAGTTATQQLNAANGVSIIDIATPSAQGVSHNQFNQFNVDPQGLILNNATAISNTQLGGFIEANPNLTGNAASLIINEVITPNRSHLKGYTEIAGQDANLIIANPYGITCNGCGFINTPRATLTTGIPTIQNGDLSKLTVNSGTINIEGLGLNAANTSQFDLITRAVEVNADLHAQKLKLILGNNDVDYATLTPTTLSASTEQPEFVLDSSLLGGMYANSIQLIGTEAGVGVRTLGNVASHSGELSLSADGKLSINNVQSTGTVSLTSQSGDIELNQQLRSEDSIHLVARDTISNENITTAFNDITVNATNVVQRGSLISGVTVQNSEDNETVYLLEQAGTLNITATNELNNSGHITSGGELSLTSRHLTNQDTSTISSRQMLNLEGDKITNQGKLNSVASLNINLSDALNNSDGLIEAADTLKLTANTLTNRAGTITSIGSDDDVILTTTNTLDNTAGSIGSNARNFNLNAANIINDNGSLSHTGTGNFTLTTTAGTGTGLSNLWGNIGSNTNLIVTTGSDPSRTDIDNTSGSLDATAMSVTTQNITNDGGVIKADTVTLTAHGHVSNQRDEDDLISDNNSGLISALGNAVDALTLSITGWLNNSGGQIETRAESATITSSGLINQGGKLIHTGNGLFTLNTTGADFNNRGGMVDSNGGVNITAANLDNSAGTLLTRAADLSLTLSGTLTNNGGLIEAADTLNLTVNTLTNRGGTITSIGSDDDVTLTTTSTLDNTAGSIGSNARNFTLNAANIINDNGTLTHKGVGNLTVQADEISNRGGFITSAGRFVATNFTTIYNSILNGKVANIQADHIELAGQLIDNTGGKIVATGANSININANQLNNDNGLLNSQGDLDLTLSSLANNAGVIQSNDDLTLNLPNFDFNNGIFNATNNLVINTSGNLINGIGNQLITQGSLTLNTTGSIDNQGELSSFLDISLSGSTLTNRAGAIISAGNMLDLSFTNSINNAGRLSAARDLTLSAINLDNSGIVAAGNDLQTTLSGKLDNYNTLFAANNSQLYVNDTLYNHEGANIFSINTLIIAANNSLAKNQEIINESATIESYEGNISLYSDTVSNRKKDFTVNDGRMISGSITYHCYDCIGDHYRVDYTITEKFESEIADTSPSASLISGGDLLIDAGTLNNQHSSISADGDLLFTLDNLNNSSSGDFDLTRATTYFSGEITDGTHKRSRVNEINAYNHLNSPTTYALVDISSCAASGSPICFPNMQWRLVPNGNYNINATHSSYNPFPTSYSVRGTTEEITNTGQVSSASIQAAGTANITIAGLFNNGDAREM